MQLTGIKKYPLVITILYPMVTNSQPLESLKADAIRKAWKLDSFGFGVRDSITTVLINDESLYGLTEKEVYSLLGRPINTIVYEEGKIVSYLLIGSYDRTTRKCNPELVYKVLRISFDAINNKVFNYVTWEE